MPFPDHIRAGFSLGYLHRHALRQLLDNTPLNSNILGLDPGELQLTGVAALALDFDGVLAHHGAPVPDSAAVAWMKRCETIFGGDNIFILSNKPTDERRQWFAEHFPAMRFISGVRKKPFPDGLWLPVPAPAISATPMFRLRLCLLLSYFSGCCGRLNRCMCGWLLSSDVRTKTLLLRPVFSLSAKRVPIF